jgi:hypothetical protein
MININLIAERRSRKIRESLIISYSWLAVFMIFVVMLLINGLAVVQAGARHAEADRLVLALDDSRRAYTTLQEKQNHIAELAPKVRLLEQVRVSEAAWMTIIADLGRITADSVVLESFGATAGDKGVSLHLTGKASDQTAVAKFLEALPTKTGWVDAATSPPRTGNINTVAVGKQQTVTFDVAVTVNGLMGGDF